MGVESSYHGGGHGIYQSHDGRKGHRDVSERDDRVIEVLGKNNYRILDIGCNIGYSLMRLVEAGVGAQKLCTGIDVDQEYINYAKNLAFAKDLEIEYVCENFALKESITPNSYDVILLYSVWDYFSVSSDVLNVIPNEANVLNLINTINPKFIVFEGHADGPIRMENDLLERGQTHESWNKIINKIGCSKFEFLKMTDNNRRPLYLITR